MLSQAVARHVHAEKGKANSETSTRQLSTVRTTAGIDPCVLSQSRSGGNAIKTASIAPTKTRAVKRTSSGLSKAISNSSGGFDENPSSTTRLTQSEIFSEDDFDSDLDVNLNTHFAAHGDTKKAKLTTGISVPQPTCNTARPNESTLITHTQYTKHDEWGHDNAPPPSSDQAVPWSSSPPSHFGPHPSRTASLYDRFAYPSTIGDRESKKGSEAQVSTPAPAPKRRTLPWQKSASDDVSLTNGRPNQLIKAENFSQPSHFTTPAATITKKALPWDKTSSAIKEQQRDIRETNKARSQVSKISADVVAQMWKQKSKEKNVASVFLSSEQQQVAHLVTTKGQSVFFTGSAGTGKSVLLREIIKLLRIKHVKEPDRVAVTASTGLAACNIGGVTLHSFAGFGLGKEDVSECVKKIKRNGKAKQRWLRTKILIIDEISMVDAELFDKLEAIAREVRRNGRPFGGMQLVITGDFFQLPPVPDRDRVAKFAFDAGTWGNTINHTIGLHHVFRQKDPVFAGMLNEMREGKLTPQSIQMFNSLSRPLGESNDLMATELFPTRQEVEKANSTRMAKLVGTSQTYDARDGGTTEVSQRERLLSNCMAPKTLHLKKGSQVMLIKNVDEGLVNGSVGKVIAFVSESFFERSEPGNLQIDGIKDEFDEALTEELGGGDATGTTAAASHRLQSNLIGSTTPKFPLVRFILENGTTRDLLCQRETWKIELPNGEVQASRSQVPLILAWALSIHKAQGQTLERVKVDLGRVFEKGQAYVALSRATTMQGLQVLRFDPKKVMAHDKVKEFYNKLERV